MLHFDVIDNFSGEVEDVFARRQPVRRLAVVRLLQLLLDEVEPGSKSGDDRVEFAFRDVAIVAKLPDELNDAANNLDDEDGTRPHGVVEIVVG